MGENIRPDAGKGLVRGLGEETEPDRIVRILIFGQEESP